MFHRLTFAAIFSACALSVTAQVSVPVAAPEKGVTHTFHDSRYGVRFSVPPGWDLNKKDRQVSTFRMDAHSAKPSAEMRAVASINFNPFPLSTLSGALLYYSVERHSNDRECEQQAIGEEKTAVKDIQNIGGMEFTHGHEEHGSMCLESRDDVYTAYRKGSCYRFDLAVNLFCSEVSGAKDITLDQMRSLEGKMADILSTVTLDWEKTGPHPVSAPVLAPDEPYKPIPRPAPSTVSTQPALGSS